ncbi:uncharacterized protein [Procambarus clarkii]|uniref:uncharacterized protein n=1 Tax=Procambarus clarkii TaxID=6728 RepID=UPI003743C3D1
MAVSAEEDSKMAVSVDKDSNTAVSAEEDSKMAVLAEEGSNMAVSAEEDSNTAASAEEDSKMEVLAEEGSVTEAMTASSHMLHIAHKRPPYRPHARMNIYIPIVSYWVVLLLVCVTSTDSAWIQLTPGLHWLVPVHVIDTTLQTTSAPTQPNAQIRQSSESPNKDKSSTNVTSSATSANIVDKEIAVKVFADNWDDMETCPYWCKRDNGSLRCCPNKETREGSCPEPKEVCIKWLGNIYKHKDHHYCADDRACPDKHKCCFDRCAEARVCTPALQ